MKQTLEEKEYAWIGDAVLALFARSWILKTKDINIKERAFYFELMTSNNFLSELGNPTRIESEIGIVYRNQGLESAMNHIENKILPHFIKSKKKKKFERYNIKKANKMKN